jgi:hypothetical protein
MLIPTYLARIYAVQALKEKYYCYVRESVQDLERKTGIIG